MGSTTAPEQFPAWPLPKTTQELFVLRNEEYFNIDVDQSMELGNKIGYWLNQGFLILTSFVVGNYTVIVFQKTE